MGKWRPQEPLGTRRHASPAKTPAFVGGRAGGHADALRRVSPMSGDRGQRHRSVSGGKPLSPGWSGQPRSAQHGPAKGVAAVRGAPQVTSNPEGEPCGISKGSRHPIRQRTAFSGYVALLAETQCSHAPIGLLVAKVRSTARSRGESIRLGNRAAGLLKVLPLSWLARWASDPPWRLCSPQRCVSRARSLLRRALRRSVCR